MRLPYLLIAVTVSLLAALPACTEEAAPAEKSEANGQIDPGADSEPVGETVATKSGLQITMLKEGTGPSPKASDRVEVHYHGTFEDGTVFDSSVDRGKTVAPGHQVLDRRAPADEGRRQSAPRLPTEYRLRIPPQGKDSGEFDAVLRRGADRDRVGQLETSAVGW